MICCIPGGFTCCSTLPGSVPDESHHVPAAAFEHAVKQIPARRWLGLTAKEWTPRELRHSFVSLLSDADVPIEHIARLIGHISTAVTETVYRQQIRPVLVEGAEAMDRIFRDSA